MEEWVLILFFRPSLLREVVAGVYQVLPAGPVAQVVAQGTTLAVEAQELQIKEPTEGDQELPEVLQRGVGGVEPALQETPATLQMVPVGQECIQTLLAPQFREVAAAVVALLHQAH